MYEDEIIAINASHATDSRIQTAAHYLKALHWFDRPVDLMPIDGRWMKASRRFYDGLSPADQEVIDSFSDEDLYHSLNLRKRNRRFNALCRLFLETAIEPEPLKRAEKG